MMSRTRTLIAIGLLVLTVSCSSAQQEQPVNDAGISVSSFEEMHYPALARAARRESMVVVQVKLDDANTGYPVEHPQMAIPPQFQ
jgi:hypothetical protein